jgi:hypothetical protein
MKTNKNKEIPKWAHIIQHGITLLTLLPTTGEESKNKQGNDMFKFETENHHSEYLQRKGLTQPKTSYVLLGKKVIPQIQRHIINHYNGITPPKLNLAILRLESGWQKIYKVRYQKDDLEFFKAIELLEKFKFKELYNIFQTNEVIKSWKD